MKHPDLLSAIFWLALGLLLTFWSSAYSFGEVNRPGPGFFPFCLGILLILLATLLLAKTLKASSVSIKSASAAVMFGEWKRVALIVVILLIASFVFEQLGYLITLFAMVLFSMRGGGGSQSWKKIFLVSALATVSVYLVFVLLLKQLLPTGILGG